MATDDIKLVGHLREFDCVNSDWTIYKRRLENFFIANGITDENRKRAILLNSFCEDSYKLVRDLCIPDEPESKDYSDLIKLMNDNFKSSLSVFAARYTFYNARKMLNESAKEWAARLRNLAGSCNYESAQLEMVLRDVFLIGYNKGAVQDRLMEEKKTVTFKELVELAAIKSATQPSCQMVNTAIKKEADVYYAHSSNSNYNDAQQRHPGSYHSKGATRSANSTSNSSSEKFSANATSSKCTVCGRRNHQSDKCSFRECYCHVCNKKGHLAPMCQNKNKRKQTHSKNVSKQTNFLESSELSLYNLETEIISNNVINENKSENELFHINTKTKPILIDIFIDGISYAFNLDTGSSFSVISQEFYHNNFGNKILFTTNKYFNLYNGDKIVPVGYITCSVIYNNINKSLNIYVIENGSGPPLLGRDFFSLFDLSISNLNFIELPEDLQFLISKYNNVFSPGLGTFTKGFISIKLKSQNVTPKFFRARPLPFAMKEKVEKELDRLLNLGILEPIDFSVWGTPVVPVLKKDGTVRLCGDFKVSLNPYIEVDQYPLPRIEELFVKLQGGTHFSKLDLQNAYQQVCLDEDSKDLVTISTHRGLYRYNRAPFGIASIPAKFQKLMESLFQGIANVVVFLDDILITGKTRQEHISNLDKVFNILERAGLKIALDKCAFFQPRISYLGFDISKEGLHTSENKIKAIKEAPQPKNVTQLKSFIGLINYYGKFVPKLSTILAPLYNLLKTNVKWNWTNRCEEAYTKIKKMLIGAEILVHYNPDWMVRLSTDASQDGVGAVISHILPSGIEKPIAYASRTLSNSEKKYSQIEKEGLSIIFGLCKFNQYLYGRKFVLATDHKPLTTIFHPEKGIPQFSANRLRRWAVILSNYQYEIEYVRSEKNYADSLSRLSITEKEEDWENVDVNFINYFSNNTHFPIDFKVMRQETLRDEVLKKVKAFVIIGWPQKIPEFLKPYSRIKNELTLDSDCILWNNRLIVPSTLQNKILENLHSSHMGVVKMKSMARSYFWWPAMNKRIEEICSSCESCILHKKSPDKAALENWVWPSQPWSRLHLDFMGPFLNKYYLIIVDSHSKWLEVYPMNLITSKVTIDILRTLFARFGLPYQIVTDNGPTFCSREFKEFLDKNCIEHFTTAPYQPSSNGAAENAVKTVKNALKNALGKSTSFDLNRILNNFLFDYRNTPHCTTNVSPAQLMFKRDLRTRFSVSLPDAVKENLDLKNRVLAMQKKQKMYHGGHRFLEFGIGDKVIVKDYRTPKKCVWIKGVISKRIAKSIYLVKIPELDQVWKRHLNQIKSVIIKETLISQNDNQTVSNHENVTDLANSPQFCESANNNDNNFGSAGESSNNEGSLVKIRPKRQIKPVSRLEYKNF